MVTPSHSDSSVKARRKSRFDDPNPVKRTGFSDSKHSSTNVKPNYNLQNVPKPNNNLNNLQQNVNFQTTVFQPQLVPPFVPPPVFQPIPQFQIPTQNPGFPVPTAQLSHFNPPISPSLNGLNNKLDFDTCNVGVMASILIEHRDKISDFVPYKPFDDLDKIPNKQDSEAVGSLTLTQRNKVEDFYDELEEIFEQYRAEIDPNDASLNYSRRRNFNFTKQTNQPLKILTQDDVINPAKREYYASGVYGSKGRENPGLGSGDDLFETFRRKRSTKYHENYAIREAVRKDPNCIVITPGEIYP
ncbi:hypothetical protein TpMuguga_01g01112 [Theileria parva strain Muguga]|uniref:uncharacterized protein n=1 Tax=Theileria parva strain Muguga TaxID=333668 RepID=UPI001C6172C9|nr:uncharacterized protein TpMuguga_01g01112 [Theileria parva strain Muguga]KAF5153501.1 hypothetical protein TpMuguga_01g01112 [Theileria parva strain Muguga]